LNNIENKEILVIEDIMDTGLSLHSFINHLVKFKPRSIENCVMLKIPEKHKYDVPVKFVAFKGPSVFYIGFGLDYNEYFRDFPHIGVPNQQAINHFKIWNININYKLINISLNLKIMGKQKVTKKFAAVKRLINPSDPRIKKNKEKEEKKKKEIKKNVNPN
jgi:hypothetical protein